MLIYLPFTTDPVEDVYVDQDNCSLTIQKTSLSEVIFIEDQPTTIRCIARGGSPPPELRVYLGADDYTKYFRYDVISTISGSVGFRTIHRTSALTSNDILVSSKDDGKRLNCVARVFGLNKVVSSSSLVVNCKNLSFLTGTITV